MFLQNIFELLKRERVDGLVIIYYGESISEKIHLVINPTFTDPTILLAKMCRDTTYTF
jgi:hypothetical protein